jgi:hypothetical protein
VHKTRERKEGDATEQSGHGGVELSGHGEPLRRERSARAIVAARGEKRSSVRSARA